jgi:hypothetical protein
MSRAARWGFFPSARETQLPSVLNGRKPMMSRGIEIQLQLQLNLWARFLCNCKANLPDAIAIRMQLQLQLHPNCNCKSPTGVKSQNHSRNIKGSFFHQLPLPNRNSGSTGSALKTHLHSPSPSERPLRSSEISVPPAKVQSCSLSL